MSTYAASDSNYGYAFSLPRVIETDSSPDCVLNTSLGKYSGKIINASTSSYGSAIPIAMAVFTEDQKKEINQYFVDCANSVFDMMRTGADRDSYSAYLLDSNAVSAIFDVDGDDKQAAIANEANAVFCLLLLTETATIKHIFRCFWPRQSEIISWSLLQASVLVAKVFIRSFLKTSWISAI